MVKRRIVNLEDGTITEDTQERYMGYYLFLFMRSQVKLGEALFRRVGKHEYEYFNWKCRVYYTVVPKN